MRITRCNLELLHVPLDRPRASKREQAAGRLNHVVVLLAQLETDAGLQGLGMAYMLHSSGRALYATARMTWRRSSSAKTLWTMSGSRPRFMAASKPVCAAA